jgi:hypothetical protein
MDPTAIDVEAGGVCKKSASARLCDGTHGTVATPIID